MNNKNDDLKIIKKKYGEKMMHFCRMRFSSLLEMKGMLSKKLLEKFYPNHDLYDDLVKEKLLDDFSSYILKSDETKEEVEVSTSVLELFHKAGYDFYECKSEEEIQSFRKYYEEDEELCTFDGNRLDTCYVFFAVKKDVDQIKREDFPSPKRDDLYGTSVISIQFSRNRYHMLSIKNRYNHTVDNPDATFSNNLDNIIPGLTKAFENDYGMVQIYKNDGLQFCFNYVMANDGRYYKYNYEINNIYYCPDNIIIDNMTVKKYPKEKYIIFDCFVLDLVNKELCAYDKNTEEVFDLCIPKLSSIVVKREKEERQITLMSDYYSPILLKINKNNELVGLVDDNIEQLDNDYLSYNETLKNISMKNVRFIGHSFLGRNVYLESLDMPKLEQVGNGFLMQNEKLSVLDFPNLKKVGDSFLHLNAKVFSVFFPVLESVGDRFLVYAPIEEASFPNLEQVGYRFMDGNQKLREIELPMLKYVGEMFLSENIGLKNLYLPKLVSAPKHFLFNNCNLEELLAPNLTSIGDYCLMHNRCLKKLYLDNVKFIGNQFLYNNICLEAFHAPKLKRMGNGLLHHNSSLKEINVPFDLVFDDYFTNKYRGLMEKGKVLQKKIGFKK